MARRNGLDRNTTGRRSRTTAPAPDRGTLEAALTSAQPAAAALRVAAAAPVAEATTTAATTTAAATATAVVAIVGERLGERGTGATRRGTARAERSPRPILRHVDAERSTLEVLAVELADRLLRLLLARELDEGEASWAPGGAIDRDGDVHHVADGAQMAPQLMLGRVVGKVPHEDSSGDDDAPYGRWLEAVGWIDASAWSAGPKSGRAAERNSVVTGERKAGRDELKQGSGRALDRRPGR